MGKIKSDVENILFSEFPEQEKLIKPFLNGFDITFANKYEINNTVLFGYILKPEDFMKEPFGLNREMLLAYTPFDDFQPRALQAVNMLFNRDPFINRIDTLNCFLLSKDPEVLNHAGITSFSGEESRSIVPFVTEELLSNSSDNWYIRNVLRKNLYGVDLFDFNLPLRDEANFFGRQQIIARYIDSIKRNENRGIFGLRKTGKTSFLFKLERVIREQKIGLVFYYDCKSPSYRMLHWYELLGEICNNIANRMNISTRAKNTEKSIIKNLRYVVKEAAALQTKIIIMFDEIEYISFISPMNDHWKNEFIDFWQSIWSIQSVHRNFVFIISGVNPSLTEIDTVNGIQNPLFGIVTSEYLQGLTEEETREMIRSIGRRMGLKFEADTIKLLFDQFNGHPMLLRRACSYINGCYDTETRPITIDRKDVENRQSELNSSLSYYFKHVVSEIQTFYPDEYEMFEILAAGQVYDFMELSSIEAFTKHLYAYGLVAREGTKPPYVKMPVAGRYVAAELAKKENRTSLYRLINYPERKEWVTKRAGAIIRDIRKLEMAIKSNGLVKLFGDNSFPQAEEFSDSILVNSHSDFVVFINTCNKCFVESIDNYGKSIGIKNYFFADIKNSYPALFAVLHRIRVYRNKSDHLVLKQDIARKYDEYWSEDTEGFASSDDEFFAVQQHVLDDFLTAIQIELESIHNSDN